MPTPTTASPVDAVFHALAHPARRRVVERIARGPASASELAAPFVMAGPSFHQHLRVLERCGAVRSRKRGRVRTYELAPERLTAVADWLAEQREFWESRLDRLDAFLLTLED